MSKTRTAIIIGGGPAGLATALSLHQKTNISCSVYELRPEPTTLGGAIGIQPNGLRILHQLGLLDAILSHGCSHSNLTIRSLQGSVLGKQDIVGGARKQTGFGYSRIKRTELLDVLLEAVHKAEIPVYYDKRITAIEDNDYGVTATFSDGTTHTADMLLGCDGIHSAVRQLYVDPLLVPEYSGQASLSSLVPTSVLPGYAPSQLQGLNGMMTQEGMFMVMTCTKSGDELYWGFSGEVPLPDSGRDGWEVHRMEDVEQTKSRLSGLLQKARGEWGSVMKQVVDKTSFIKLYPIYRLPSGGSYFKGRCLLLGDAAHAMQPNAGQGVSMAVEDAFLLSRLLEDPARSLDDVYKRFDHIRRPRVDEISKLAARNAQVRTKTGPWGLRLKELGVGLYFSIPRAFGEGAVQKHLIYDIDKEVL